MEQEARLGGRYRLEDRITASAGWSAWKAADEGMRRPVTLLTFPPNFARARDVTTAVHGISKLTDRRFSQVLDMDEYQDGTYVVMEWITGDSLHDLLIDGPLDPTNAALLIAEAADALSIAHRAGLAHLCLTPGGLRRRSDGVVKIVGLGIDAALSGTMADDPALADTQGLGRLLYAALTAHWPGNQWPSLPPAPLAPDGSLSRPRQVQVGIPALLDDLTWQAMLQISRASTNGEDSAGTITTPDKLYEALILAVPEGNS
jgi:serine/threonine protein kinase